jgi:hypothetical protein
MKITNWKLNYDNKRIAPLPFFHGCMMIPAFTPEMDCDQTAIGLPVTSVVPLIAKAFWQNVYVLLPFWG